MSKERSVFVVARPQVNGWGLYEEHSSGHVYVGRLNGDGALGGENTANNVEWRAYDRSLFTGVETPPNPAAPNSFQGHRIFWFQQNAIQESISLPVPFTVVHTVTGMQNLLDFGVHTGLYTVVGTDRQRYVCGLYPGANGGETGWVKWNALTNVWTSGIVTGTTRPTGNRMSACVSHDGQLCHANNGVLTFFDPAGETITQLSYGNGSSIDRVIVSTGDLYIVSAGAGQIVVHQLLFGLNAVAALGAHNINIAGGGGFALMRFGLETDHNKFYVMFYTQSGGTGSRCVLLTTTAGSVPVAADRTTMAPTAILLSQLIVSPFTLFYENMQWPGGSSHATYSYETCFDNVDYVPYVPSLAAPWGHLKLYRVPIFSTSPPGQFLSRVLKFNGEINPIIEETIGVPPGGITGIELGHQVAVSTSWIGADDTRHNEGRSKVWPVGAEQYSDGTTPNGVLVKFWIEDAAPGGVSDVLILIGRNRMRPNQVATLAAADDPIPNLGFAFDYGGTASFNPALNRLEKCNGSRIWGQNEKNRVLGYGPNPPSAMRMNPGAALNEWPAGPKGGVIVAVKEGRPLPYFRPHRAYVVDQGAAFMTGGDFVFQVGGVNNGEVFGIGAEAVSTVLHQCIIDLDAHGIPPGETIIIQPLMFATGMVGNPLVDNTTYSGHALEHLVGPGAVPFQIDSNGPVVESFVETQSQLEVSTEGQSAAVLTTSQTATASSLGPTVETFVETDADVDGRITSGPAVEAVPDTLLVPQDILKGRGAEPHEEGGGVIAWLADTVEGSARNVANVTNNGKPGELLTLSLGAIPDFGVELDGVVELGRVTIDCVNDPLGTEYPMLDMTAAGLLAAGVLAARIVITDLTGGLSIPNISIGINSPTFDDVYPDTGVLAIAQDTFSELSLGTLGPLPVMRPGDVLTAKLNSLSVSTTYVVEVVAYGFHRIP